MDSKYKIVKTHYNSIATYYGISDEASISHIFATRIKRVNELLDNLNGLNVISVGTGPAPMASYVLEKKGKFFGVDISQNMLYEAQKRHPGEELLLAVGNMGKLPFRDSSFDLLLCLGALEYSDNVQLAINEFSRVMKPNAIIIISMQNKFSPYRFWDRKIYSGTFFNSIRKLRQRPTLGAPMEDLIPLKDLKDLLLLNSLEVVDYLYYNFNIFLKPLDRYFPKLSVMIAQRLESMFHSKLGGIGADFIVKAQKILIWKP